MSSELPLIVEVARPPRRTWAQRLLLTVGVVCTVLAVAGASVVGWGAWKLRSIDRTDVALDALLAGGPANYLIVGSDTRAGGDPIDSSADASRAPLADTLMLVRIDPATSEARVLSLPRDLWIDLPSTGEKGRVNAAYVRGPQELVDTLRSELDVEINHYVEVDFRGFQEIVTAVDGVPMWFDRAMRDRNSGLDVLHPGCVVLDGRGALAFARARHLEYFEDGGFTDDGTGDLGRISRQQLFLRRVIDRARVKGVSNPLILKRLVDVGVANVTIDDELSVTELAALGRQFSSFDSAALQTYTLPNIPRTTDGGAQIVELDPAAAEPILDLFRDVPPADVDGSSSTIDADSLPAPSEVAITVLNSSGQQGLALRAADDLVAVGFEVDHFGNGDELDHSSEASSVVRHAPGSEDEARATAAQVEGRVDVEEDPTLDEGEVVLFLGADFVGIDPVTATDGPASRTGVDDPADPTESTTTVAAAATTQPPQAETVGMSPLGAPPANRSCS